MKGTCDETNLFLANLAVLFLVGVPWSYGHFRVLALHPALTKHPCPHPRCLRLLGANIQVSRANRCVCGLCVSGGKYVFVVWHFKLACFNAKHDKNSKSKFTKLHENRVW